MDVSWHSWFSRSWEQFIFNLAKLEQFISNPDLDAVDNSNHPMFKLICSWAPPPYINLAPT